MDAYVDLFEAAIRRDERGHAAVLLGALEIIQCFDHDRMSHEDIAHEAQEVTAQGIEDYERISEWRAARGESA